MVNIVINKNPGLYNFDINASLRDKLGLNGNVEVLTQKEAHKALKKIECTATFKYYLFKPVVSILTGVLLVGSALTLSILAESAMLVVAAVIALNIASVIFLILGAVILTMGLRLVCDAKSLAYKMHAQRARDYMKNIQLAPDNAQVILD